ncbi:hypothetical protein HK104_001649 [Borealophlyctis nickersoniae]|nr:hypothetical protein HK104_001649 [Borealophlyctis nickersoniae]
MNISGSRTLEPDKRNWKYSYHIILQNYVAREIDDLYGVKEWCTLPEQRALGFDPNIYRRKGLLKCINQSKGDKAKRKKRQKKKPRTQDYIAGSRDVYDHTIHHNIPEDAKDIPQEFKEIAMTTTAAPRSKKRAGERNGGKQKKRRLENVPDIPRMNLEPPEGFDIYTADPHQQLKAMPSFQRGHKFQLSNEVCCKVVRRCKVVGIPFNEFWNWCQMKDGSENRKKKYEDYWTRSCFLIAINYLKGNLIVCYNKNILKSKAITQLSGMMNTRIDIPLIDKYLSMDLLKQAFAKSRIVNLNLGCGVGKTYVTIELINDYLREHPDHKILWMTCRIAQKNNGVALEHSGEEMKPVYQYLACSVTSLSTYIDPNVMYDLVIVDECETLLASFGGDAKGHSGTALLNWNYLTKLMQQSKMIWMDAFTTKITLDTIGAVCSEKEYCIIDAGEKVFIAVGPKGLNKPGSEATEESVEALVTILVNKYGFKRGKELLAYHSLTKAEKKKLVNINGRWGSEELRVIIGNACLAIGVNFDPASDFKHRPFDRVFVILDQSCMSTRDILQLIQRVRHPVDPDVVMYIKEGFSDATVRKREKELEAMRKINYNGIRKLAENLLIESRATLSDILRSLKLFAQKTSFKVEVDKTVFCSKEMALIQDCMSTAGHAFHWRNIKSITPMEHEKIEMMMKCGYEDVIEQQWDEHRLTTVAMYQIGKIRKFGEDTYGVTMGDGKDNVVADVLSRRPPATEDSEWEETEEFLEWDAAVGLIYAVADQTEKYDQICSDANQRMALCRAVVFEESEYDDERDWQVGSAWFANELDAVIMPWGVDRKHILMHAVEAAIGWPEAKATTANTALKTAKFLYEHVFTRFGACYQVCTD